jgi:hypothetical protein
MRNKDVSRYRKLEMFCGCAGLISLGLMVSSLWYELGCGVQGVLIRTEFGCLLIDRSPVTRRDLFGYVSNCGGHYPNRGWLSWSAPGLFPDRLGVFLPLWIPAAVAFCTAVFFHRKSRRERDGRCRKCDYDLTGNISGVCPECGTPVPQGVTDMAATDDGQPRRGE